MCSVATAERLLGNMPIKGRGVPKNFEEGISWMAKAAAKGDQAARKTLRRMNIQYDAQGNILGPS